MVWHKTSLWKYGYSTLAGMVQWLEHQPVHQGVLGSITGQGHVHVLQVWSGLQWGHMQEGQSIYVSISHQCFPLSLSTVHSLEKLMGEK